MNKRSLRAMLGVTLLEIMLVLAIAAMVIVMSIRYYQQASSNQRVNAGVDIITGFVAAGESYLNAIGTYSSVSASKLSPYLPNGTLPASPWGGTITITSSTATTFTITISGINSNDCTKMNNLLINQSQNITVTCGTNSATVKITG